MTLRALNAARRDLVDIGNESFVPYRFSRASAVMAARDFAEYGEIDMARRIVRTWHITLTEFVSAEQWHASISRRAIRRALEIYGDGGIEP